MKKLLSVMLLTAIAVGMSFGQGSKEAASASSQPAAKTGKVQIQFWHSMGGKNGDLITQVCDAFNKTHDDVEVVPSYQGDYWTAASKAINAVSAGENPDLLQMGVDHVGVFGSEEGVLADLMPYMKKDGIDPNDFIDAFSWDFKQNGKMIAIPFGRSVPVMYVNMDIMREAGVEVPTTWDELRAACEKLKKVNDKGEVERYGLGLIRDTWYWYMTVAQAGGDLINKERTGLGCVDNGHAYKAWKFLQDMKNSQELFFAPANNGGTVVTQMFADGKCAMLWNSIGALVSTMASANFDCQVFFPPKGDVLSVPTGGNALVMLEGSRHKQEAWEFIDWLLTNPNGLLFFTQNSGYLPITKTMASSEQEQELWKKLPGRKTAYERLQYADDRGSRVPQGGQIMNELYTLIDATMYDNADVQQQVDIFAKSVKDIMAGK